MIADSEVDLVVTFAEGASLLTELLQVKVDVMSRGGLRPGHPLLVGAGGLQDWEPAPDAESSPDRV